MTHGGVRGAGELGERFAVGAGVALALSGFVILGACSTDLGAYSTHLGAF